MFLAKIIVKFKQGVKNPEEKTLETLISRMEIKSVQSVSCAKFYEFQIEAPHVEEAENIAKKLAKEVLSNPIIETFEVSLCELP